MDWIYNFKVAISVGELTVANLYLIAYLATSSASLLPVTPVYAGIYYSLTLLFLTLIILII